MNTIVDDLVLLEALKHKHPQLIEKALVDLVNGLEVVDDQLRFQARPTGLVCRLWNSFVGEQSRRQHLIDEIVYTSLESVTAWLQDIQAFQTQSDLTLTIVTDRLTETRLQVENLSTEFEDAIDMALSNFAGRLEGIECQVSEIDLRSKARLQLDVQIQRWMQDNEEDLPPVGAVFLLIDRLWWGDFGGYVRRADDDKAKADLVEIAQNCIGDCLAVRLNLNPKDMLQTASLMMPLKSMSRENGEVISYLADKGDSRRTPVLHAYTKAINGESMESLVQSNLPYVLSPLGLVGRLIHESRRAYSGD
jgi:hypothetical protein